LSRFLAPIRRFRLLSTAGSTLFLLHAGVAFAQGDEPAPGTAQALDTAASVNDIVVTARRRNESLQDVPVVVTAFDAATLERNVVVGTDDLARITPGLNIYSGGNSAQQGAISLRGIQTGSTNLASDQAVAINIDNVQIDSGLGLRAGMFDLQQVEVMKGPQALYFGKNASGGVIAIKTADPTNEFFLQARGGYEIEARERYGDVVISGPLGDTLGGRVAIYYSDMDGFLRNRSQTAISDRTPNARDIIARGTLKWTPSDRLDARFKFTLADHSADKYAYQQKIACFRPGQTAAVCRRDRTIYHSRPVDVLNRFEPENPYADSRMYLASLDLDYKLSNTLSLASTTGYFDYKQSLFDSVLPRAATDTFGGVVNEILNESHDRTRSISQQLRLSSDFDGPLNFMVGAFADDRMVQSDIKLQFGGTANPRNVQRVDSRAYSVFGQLSYDILPDLELVGGARYTNEERKYKGRILEAVGPFPAGTPLVPANDTLKEDNISPEVTLTWRPSTAVTLYGAYKQGFKSGSFDISSTTNLALLTRRNEIRFDSETAKGFEGGFKTLWFGHQLRFNGALYHYDYAGLQLTSFDQETSATRVLNAAGATTKGFELEAQYAPVSLRGLVLNASLNYNDATYGDFLTDCNQGQLTTGTCPLDLTPAAGNDSQNLAGHRLRSAPRWTASWGMTLDRPLTDTLDGRAGVSFNYSSSYQTEERDDPLGIQKPYMTVNANLGMSAGNGRWSLDVLGVNLLNELYLTTSNSQPLTGGAGYRRDYIAAVARGRQVRLQLTFRM